MNNYKQKRKLGIFGSPVGTEVKVWQLEEEAGRWKSTTETRFCSGKLSLPCIKAEI